MYRYVIIEDNPIALKGAAYKMELTGYPFELVGTAENGREGYRLIERERPDLAVIDMQMADIDGVALMDMLRDSGNPVEIIIVSGHSDFQYAQAGIKVSAAAYLLKPFSDEELRGALDIVMKRIDRDKNTADVEREIGWLTDRLYAVPSRDVDMRFTHLNIDPDAGVFFVAEAHINPAEWFTPDRQGFDEMICITPPSSEHIRYLISCAKDSPAERLQETMLRAVSCALSAGISRPATGINHLHSSWRQAKQARLHRPIGESGIVFYSPDINEPEIGGDLADKLIYSLEAQDVVWFEDQLLAYYRQCKKQRTTYSALISALRSLFSKMLTRYERMADRMKLRLPSLFQFDYIVINADDDDMLIRNLISFLSDGFGEIAGRSTGSDVIANVRRYLEVHYAEDLSLERVAGAFHVSSAHLSRAFSKRMGISFSEYLTGLRMEAAKRLLREGKGDTARIAYQVGFIDEKYFYRVFKKRTGVTPAQYKKTAGFED